MSYLEFIELNGDCEKINCKACVFYGECENYDIEELLNMAMDEAEKGYRGDN